jgi:hypothetical protein
MPCTVIRARVPLAIVAFPQQCPLHMVPKPFVTALGSTAWVPPAAAASIPKIITILLFMLTLYIILCILILVND